jgi:hypothetical protein
MDTICPATHHAERSKARTFRRHLRSWGLWRTTAALRLPIDPRRAARRWIAVRTFPSPTTTRMVARHKMPAGLRVRKRRFRVGRFSATSARSSSRRSARARDAVALKASNGTGKVCSTGRGIANVRFGSKADMCGAKGHVRFTPNSDRESGLPRKIVR